MKKILFLLFILTNFLFASVGQITALVGEVKISRNNTTILAKLGEKLEKSDVINSSKASKAQITLNDNTIITIGQNSTLNIFDYAFDENNPNDSKANIGFMEGSFKSITGKIGKINKERFKLKTKSASIGIRGTTIVGNQSIIACTDGAISVTANGVTVNVEKQEFTKTPQGQAPTPAQTLTPDTLNSLEKESTNEENNNTGNGGGVTPPDIEKPNKNDDDKDKEIHNKIDNNSTKTLTGKQLSGDTMSYTSTTDNITATGTYKNNKRDVEVTFINSDSGSLTTNSLGTTYDNSILLEDALTTNSNIDYTVYSDNLGEFSYGYESAAMPPMQSNSGSFWYLGTAVDNSNFSTPKILVYNEKKFLEITKSGGEMVSNVEVKNGTGLVYINTLTQSMTYLDMDKYNNGASFDGGYLNTSDGSFTLKSLSKYEFSPGTTYQEDMDVTGSTFGSVAQGLGYSGESEVINLTTSLVEKRVQTMGAATLNTSYIINTPSNSDVSMTGLVNYISEGDGPFSAGNLELNINKYTGAISGTILQADICTVACSNYFSGVTSNLSSYFIGNDLFGVKTVSGTGYLVALPDGISGDATNGYTLTMHDDESSWGYWTNYNADINRYSTWVAGVETPTAYISNLIGSGTSITTEFSGHVLGTVTSGANIDSIKFDESNYANFTFNFGGGTNNFNGSIGFKTASNQQWAVIINNDTMNSSGFSSSNIVKDTNYGSAVDLASTGNSIDGKYYGSDLKSIGGKFNFTDISSTYNAVGVFKATK